MNALLAAVFNGKEVTVIMELQARFDEENNLYWSNRLRENGAKVIHGAANLKVHSKMIQISRYKDKKEQLFSYVGTGNFNEKSAKIYTDFALLTSDKSISNEIKKVFGLLENNLDRMVFRHLIVWTTKDICAFSSCLFVVTPFEHVKYYCCCNKCKY
jgi:polyphosphate kinase